MKFLADENIFPRVTVYLKKLGHDVKDIKESGLFRISDDKIVEIAKQEERTIISFDKHFGDILRYPPQELSGVILIRIHPPLLNDIFYALDNLFRKYESGSFKGRLIVLSKAGYRIR